MKESRIQLIREYTKLLPPSISLMNVDDINGETVNSDEAEVWKRIIAYRLVKRVKPKRILETHRGTGTGSTIMSFAYPGCKIHACTNYQTQIPRDVNYKFDLIDIDPFGFPFEALEMTKGMLADNGVLCVTSGEIISITRNLKNNFIKTKHSGRNSWKYVEESYIPWLEKYTGLKCVHFYAFPISIRAYLTNRPLPAAIFKGCPNYMWWFADRANGLTQKNLFDEFN